MTRYLTTVWRNVSSGRESVYYCQIAGASGCAEGVEGWGGGEGGGGGMV